MTAVAVDSYEERISGRFAGAGTNSDVSTASVIAVLGKNDICLRYVIVETIFDHGHCPCTIFFIRLE